MTTITIQAADVERVALEICSNGNGRIVVALHAFESLHMIARYTDSELAQQHYNLLKEAQLTGKGTVTLVWP
jgi:hypothetical protein